MLMCNEMSFSIVPELFNRGGYFIFIRMIIPPSVQTAKAVLFNTSVHHLLEPFMNPDLVARIHLEQQDGNDVILRIDPAVSVPESAESVSTFRQRTFCCTPGIYNPGGKSLV